MDQKWAGSKFFGFLWIWLNVLDDPLKGKKCSPKNVVRRTISLFWGAWSLKSPPETPGGPEGGIFSLIPIWGHRPSKISRKNWGVKILPAEKSVWLCHCMLRSALAPCYSADGGPRTESSLDGVFLKACALLKSCCKSRARISLFWAPIKSVSRLHTT